VIAGDVVARSDEDIATAPTWSQPLGACVGRGGFASVWEIVAGGVLKVAHANHELARARLAREAEALAAIGSPAVPRLLGHGVLDDGRSWIAMERISGTNVGELIASRIRIARGVEIAIAIADALARIHAAGFAHRDLKPDNIIRRADGSVVILDLGLARRLPSDPDDPNRAGVQVGSIEYMAPEQVLDATTAAVPADLYAFGCILYELCAGRPPFVGDAAALERAHAALRPPPLRALAHVSAALEEVCHDCLAKQPPRRPASAREIAERLRAVGEASASVRVQHSRSVIGEGTQPVVLLWAELPRVDRALLATLAARKIVVVSQRGRRVLGGVVGAEHADPAGAALAAARDLAAAGARVAVHLDAVLVRPGPSGVALAGDAVDRPERWLPDTPWTGVVMTRALATVSQAPTRAAEVGPGFVMLGEPGHTSELFGRDAVLSDLVADAAAALAGAGPALALLVGEHGIGKTALGTALVTRLGELDARVHLAALPPPGSGHPGHTALLELTGPITGPVVRAVGDALREAARARPTAVVLDDLHLAEHDLLDALEYATLGGESLPLWVLGLATPRLDQRRPGFGSRAERQLRTVLAPLDQDAAVAMTAALLRPAEYPPLRALRRIAELAHGNPMHLASLAREIHDRGAIRTRPNGEHFLDTTALDALPPIALGPWLAARELTHVRIELVALARVCAVLGDEIAREELVAVVEAVERQGGATTTIDIDVGLAELVSASILVTTASGRWAFRQALLEEGVYATTNDLERRALHAAALEYWQSRSLDDREVATRVARHAEAVGDRRAAAAAFSALGQHAHDEHRALDADQAWQGAVRNLDARDLARGRALLGRARARYRLQRVRDALADLEEAIAIAVEQGDAVLEIEALLEKATALDWSDDFTGSAAATTLARERMVQVGVRWLEPEVRLAVARVVYREGRFSDAVPLLAEVVGAAHESAHRETETIARVLLAPALVESRELARAETAFEQLIALCQATGDRFHLGAAYANRTWLWAARGEVERVADDLRFVIQLAREVGQAALERIATYNLSEDLLWAGALDEALRLAHRCLSLQLGHGEGSTWPDLLLVARIHAARRATAELVNVLVQLEGVELGPSDALVTEALRHVAEGVEPAHWQRLLERAESILNENQWLEIATLAATANAIDEKIRASIETMARKSPIWSRRRDF
jgi:eukaryotic-like serine/threonine-protein kinase